MINWSNFINYLLSPSFTAFVNLLALLGFIVTVYVGFGIRKIKTHYAAKIRVPELKAQLQIHVSILSELLNDYQNNKNSIAIEIARLERWPRETGQCLK
jgi:predicted ferric reductase